MARKSTEIVGFTLRVREDLRGRLERAAKKNDRSINAEMEARLEESFELANTASLIRVLSGGEFMAELLGAIAKVIELGGEWKTFPDKSVAAQVRRDSAYTALVIIFTELFSTPERPMDPAAAIDILNRQRKRVGGEVSLVQMEALMMANAVLKKVGHFSLLETTDIQRKHGLIPTAADLLQPGLLKFPSRKKRKPK